MNRKGMKAAAAGCGICALLVFRNRGQTERRPDMWGKMRQFMDDMPQDFPPRVMFDNLTVTRENTERIIEILERSREFDWPQEPGAGEV